MAARIVVNNGTLASFLNTDPTMQKALERSASALMGQAIENAPVGTSAGKFLTIGGRIVGPFGRPYRHSLYRQSFELRPYRGGWRLWNTDAFAHLVEWGSMRNSAYAPIRRAIRTSGLRFKPNVKGGSE